MKEKLWQKYLTALVTWHHNPNNTTWDELEAAFWKWSDY